jgi:hypothetical protein
MAAKIFLYLPEGLKMPALGLGTFDVSFEYSKFHQRQLKLTVV